MPDTPADTSDLRALARVILDQEDLEQAAMRPAGPPYDLEPVRRQCAKGLRVGSLLGIALGLASSGAGTATTFRQPAWAASFVALHGGRHHAGCRRRHAARVS